MDKELKFLRKKRGTLKGKVTRFGNIIEEAVQSNIYHDKEIEERLVDIKEVKREFEKVQDELEMILMTDDKEGELLEEAKERENFENDYYKVVGMAKKLVKNDKSDHDKREVKSNVVTSMKDNLQKIKIPCFDGKYEEWLPFRNLFNSMVMQRLDLTNIRKFHYLKTSLSGEPLQAIQSLELSDDNFIKAWEELQRKYENKKIIADKHISSLFKINKIERESASQLKTVVNEFLMHVRSLESLGQPTEHWDALLVYMLKSKLDYDNQRAWEDSLKTNDMPTFNQLIEFLGKRIQMLESLTFDQPSNIKSQKGKVVPFPSRRTALPAVQANRTESKCEICQGNHKLFQCPKFLKFTVPQRWEKIRELKCCFNCLRQHNLQSVCRFGNCRQCNKPHNSLLHSDKEIAQNNVGKEPDESDIVASHVTRNSQILLATAMVRIEGANGSNCIFRALLDSGAQSNFITERIVQLLGLKRYPLRLTVSGIGEAAIKINHKIMCTMASTNNKFKCDIECMVLPKITKRLPTSSVNITDWNLDGIELADPQFFCPNKIDLLIGAENFWHLVNEGQLKIPNEKNIILQNTSLGWIVSGRTNTNSTNASTMAAISVTDFRELNDSMRKFWEIEEGPERLEPSVSENECEAHFRQTVRRTENGRFIVRLPLKRNVEQLGSTQEVVRRRYFCLENRLKRNAKLKTEYDKFMKEYENMNHMTAIHSSGKDIAKYYLPHHGVINETSTTTKLRVVFDASCKSNTGLSLNDVLMVGPVVQDDLFSILLRFRRHRYAFSADVEKMYRQILIDEKDRKFQRIFWRNDSCIQEFELNTVTYGTSCAPYLATRCLAELARRERDNYPEASIVIERDTYVDDVLSGHDSLEQAIQLQTQVIEIMRKGCLRLRKWSANHSALIDNIEEEDRERTETHEVDENHQVKTLGLLWNPRRDTFSFRVKPIVTGKPFITKRDVLSNIFNLFDPLGLLAPVVIKAKIFLQDIWATRLDWDDKIPSLIQHEWEQFRDKFYVLRSCQVPRRIAEADSIDIHGFCDASERAYGACVYVRWKTQGRKVEVNLLAAKTRVAPLKKTTLPRLGLCGAVLLANLCERVRLALRHSSAVSYTLWTDSTIVLAWLESRHGQWKTFVAKRISQVHRITKADTWRYVPSKDNPADYASRGLNPNELLTCGQWWKGPSWLESEKDYWPKRPDTMGQPPEAISTVFLGVITTSPIKFNRYSSLKRIQRVTAFCMRFIWNYIYVKAHEVERRVGELTASEMRDALHTLIRLAQEESFPDEIKLMKMGKAIHKKSNLLSLHPFLDPTGLLRVGGRITHATNTRYDQQHPIILPKKHQLSMLIAEEEHKRQLHAPPQLLLSCLRNNYWPLNGRNLTKMVVRKCMKCFRQTAKPINQLMGELPSDRVNPSRPFTACGVDYAGPIDIKQGGIRSSKVKCYICLFVCLSIKAVHLELVSSLSSEAFIQALRRFVARRGRPSTIYSDNATNFVGADRLLQTTIKEIQQSTTVATFLAQEGIMWKFIPPRAPHFGGLWEAGIKSVKYHLRRQLANATLTFEELYTVLTQIEACLNSRPLTPLSSDPHDLSPLTPGHFLVGEPLSILPENCLSDVPISRLRRFQRVQRLVQNFWKRWTSEYLPTQQQRTKWRLPSENITVGRLVIIQDDSLPPACWKLGRVIAVHPGRDGKVRVASLKTASGELTRPISKLCPLPDQDEDTNISAIQD